jgi:hypothetical protein
MSTRDSVLGRVCCGLVVVGCAVAAASADEFFYRLNDPFSPRQGGTWTVRSGGHWVQYSNRGMQSPGRGAAGSHWRNATNRNSLDSYRDVDGLYYLPPPERRVGGKSYSIRDYGFSSTLPSVWRRNLATRRTQSARRSRAPQVR